MKKLTLALFVLLLLPVGASAHTGTLGLYTDGTLSDCDSTIGAFQTVVVQMYYWKDNGPDMGNACEFKLALSTGNAIISPPPTWNPLFTVTLGDPSTGIALTAGGCLGVGVSTVLIGDISILNFAEFGRFTLQVLPSNTATTGTVNITICDGQNTIQSVLGGTFVFNALPGQGCSVGTMSATWGAIKALYR